MYGYCANGHYYDSQQGPCPSCAGSRAGAPKTVFEDDFEPQAPPAGARAGAPGLMPTMPPGQPTVSPIGSGVQRPPVPPPWQQPWGTINSAPRPQQGPGTRMDEDEPERLLGFLVIREPSQVDEYRYVRLRKGVNVIGKFGSRAAVELRDGLVSDMHALIICTNQAARLVDLDSTNGTWIERQRTEYKQLEEGDRIVVGRTELTYVPFQWVAG